MQTLTANRQDNIAERVTANFEGAGLMLQWNDTSALFVPN